MSRPLLIIIGLLAAVITAAGIMHYHRIQSIKLPIMTLERTEGRGFPGLEQQKTVYLPNDYGFLLNYLQTEPEFYLYNRPAWTITVTGDFRQFIAGLKQFPDGVKVDEIEKCQVSFSRGMPAAEREWLNETIEEKRFRMTDCEDNNFMIECCEFQEMLLLRTTGRPAEGIREPETEKMTPEQIVELADKLYNGSPDDVYCAVKALRELKSREAIKQVIEFLSHPESETRNAAADILGFWQAEKAIPPLIRLLSDLDAEVRHSSVYALILLNAREAIPGITGLLSDSDARVRSKAVDALDELYAVSEAAPAIIKLLSDPDEDVRWEAIWALNKSEEAIPEIKRLLSDPKDNVRKAAEEVLRESGMTDAEIQKAREPGLQTKVFQFNYIRLADVDDKQDNPDFQSLRPKMVQDFIDRLNAIKSKDGTITLEPDRHRIVICDTPQVLELAQNIINAEDKPPIQYQIKTAVITLGAPETMIKIQAECDNKKLDEALATIKSKYKAQVSPLLNLLLIDGKPGTYSIGEVEKDGTEKGLKASFLIQPAEKSAIYLRVKASDTRTSVKYTMHVTTRLMNNTIAVLQRDVANPTVNQDGIPLTDTFWLVEVSDFKNKEGK